MINTIRDNDVLSHIKNAFQDDADADTDFSIPDYELELFTASDELIQLCEKISRATGESISARAPQRMRAHKHVPAQQKNIRKNLDTAKQFSPSSESKPYTFKKKQRKAMPDK